MHPARGGLHPSLMRSLASKCRQSAAPFRCMPGSSSSSNPSPATEVMHLSLCTASLGVVTASLGLNLQCCAHVCHWVTYMCTALILFPDAGTDAYGHICQTTVLSMTSLTRLNLMSCTACNRGMVPSSVRLMLARCPPVVTDFEFPG